MILDSFVEFVFVLFGMVTDKRATAAYYETANADSHPDV